MALSCGQVDQLKTQLKTWSDLAEETVGISSHAFIVTYD